MGEQVVDTLKGRDEMLTLRFRFHCYSDDERRVRVFYDKRMSQEVPADSFVHTPPTNVHSKDSKLGRERRVRADLRLFFSLLLSSSALFQTRHLPGHLPHRLFLLLYHIISFFLGYSSSSRRSSHLQLALLGTPLSKIEPHPNLLGTPTHPPRSPPSSTTTASVTSGRDTFSESPVETTSRVSP